MNLKRWEKKKSLIKTAAIYLDVVQFDFMVTLRALTCTCAVFLELALTPHESAASFTADIRQELTGIWQHNPTHRVAVCRIARAHNRTITEIQCLTVGTVSWTG